MVFLTPTGDYETAYRLNTFETPEACQIERDRIGFQMAESYPADLSFRIICHEKNVGHDKTALVIRDK
jgi:hypothetical protein